MSDFEGKNTGNVIGGYKAALNNDNVSEEAKKEAEEKIEQIKNSGGDMSADYKPPAQDNYDLRSSDK